MIGKTISHYKIKEKLGEGGMGVVYRAEDTKLKRTVALKFLASRALGTEDDRVRFMNEARAAAALNHPNICTIHEINESEEQPFIVMEYLEGKSLENIIKSGQITQEEALDIASQIAEGLKEAHRNGIVHRDIKPSNIMISNSGRVKIMDFGLASAPGGSRLTKEGTTLGTVAYMSPEQTRGEPVDHRADIWAFGVILYQMLTGRLPFRGDYDQAVIYSILNEDPMLHPESIASIPVGLESVVEKALKKSPAERYQNLENLLKDLYYSAETSNKGKTRRTMEPASGDGTPVWRKTIYITAALIILIAAVLTVSRFIPEKTEATIESIAVLPLENLSGDPDQEYISDGMTESLITQLSQIRSLNIISRTSVMRYKDTDKSLPEIARELGVDAVIEGSAILVGDKIRITTQLIEAKSDRHLWAQDFDREFKDVLSLQKEVAISVVRQVRAVLTPEEEAELTESHEVDPEVQKLYLRGRYHIGRLTVRDQERGIEYMKKVIAITPDYGLAYVSIAEALNNLIALERFNTDERWEESKKWAEQALEIDDSLGEAYLMIADYKALYQWDWVGAEEYYRRCLELSPASVTAHLYYCTYLLRLGRDEEARKLIERAYELSPNDPGVLLNLAAVHSRSGENERALEFCNDVIDLFPELTLSFYFVSNFSGLHMDLSRFDDAERILREGIAISASPLDSFRLAPFYAITGKSDKARELLQEMLSLPENELLREFIALTFVHLGEIDQAFAMMEKAIEERDQFLVRTFSGKDWAPLRDDPRFPDLCRRIGFPACLD